MAGVLTVLKAQVMTLVLFQKPHLRSNTSQGKSTVQQMDSQEHLHTPGIKKHVLVSSTNTVQHSYPAKTKTLTHHSWTQQRTAVLIYASAPKNTLQFGRTASVVIVYQASLNHPLMMIATATVTVTAIIIIMAVVITTVGAEWLRHRYKHLKAHVMAEEDLTVLALSC